jgi:hypothetical protein
VTDRRIDGMTANANRKRKRRPRKPRRFTNAPYERQTTAVSGPKLQIVGSASDLRVIHA